MTPVKIWADEVAEVWHGDSQDPACVAEIMGDRKANALIFDGPFSEKTHKGHANGRLTADRAAGFGRTHNKNGEPYHQRRKRQRDREMAYSRRKSVDGESGRRDIEYAFWTPTDVENFSDLWVPFCSGWCVSITDDVLAPHWGSSFECNDLLRFAPLPLVETGSRVRMMGDGPSNWTAWVIVARPRNIKFARWGTLNGAYIVPGERLINSSGGSDRIIGGKPLKAMLAIVRDYSRPGDLVCDPTCGAGTTLVAAKMLGRRCIGIDSKLEHAELSAKLLADTRQQLVLPKTDASELEQKELFA